MDKWALTEVRGWGPDHSDIIVWCPEGFCPWEHEWHDTVNLGEIMRTVQEHLREQHGGE